MATAPNPGGIEKWLRLVEATGLSRNKPQRDSILPATRFAVQPMLTVVSTRPHLGRRFFSHRTLFTQVDYPRTDRMRQHYHGFLAASIIHRPFNASTRDAELHSPGL